MHFKLLLHAVVTLYKSFTYETPFHFFVLRIRNSIGDDSFSFLHSGFYRAMHFSAKRGIAIACRLSVRL